MKVYITYDKDFHEIICVHQMPNIDCEICKPIRELKDRNDENNLVEIEKEVMALSPKTYNSPAVLGYYGDEKRREENIVSTEESCPDQCCGIFQEEPQYHNPRTNKTQKLFDTLNKVYTVCYKNPYVGWKGEALYITLEAENQAMAKDLALVSKKFTKHIQMKYFDRKYLYAYQPKGNYVIGEVKYFEGDERL